MRPFRSIYQIAFVGSSAVEIIKHLYSDCSVALDRKHSVAKEVLNDV